MDVHDTLPECFSAIPARTMNRDHSEYMTASHPSGHSSDRQVLFATLLVGVTAVLMLVSEVLDRLDVKSYFLRLYSSLEITLELLVIVSVAWAGRLALREMKRSRRATALAHEARTQVECLFHMTDMLQSALGYGDANAVLRATAAKLLPGLGGALYVFNNSGDRLELSSSWAWEDGNPPADTIFPPQCWALKRGKPHLNNADANALHCEHYDHNAVTLEIPMMARGEVYGLLAIQSDDIDAVERLSAITQVAAALADAMSLALANISLREKLRTQALRDPLTGLYNRRYLEDVLDRYVSLAERSNSPLSIVMIDLDHFKRLNDEQGHAVGDAVLCEVAAAIVGAIRPGDVACRYGGEELVVLFPDCGMIEALVKAEMLRARIERLSENHGTLISASFGVATIPDTSSKAGDALADADAALYRAKEAGRNRVAGAGKPGSPAKPAAVPAVERKPAAKAA
jgi:diguanylate cyclase (GGDEF)-like protein